MKVLVSAYACEPGKGSEPGVGWNWVKQIAQFCDTWVITRANNQKSIEKALNQEQVPNIHWIYFDLPHWAKFWKKGQRGVHLYYYLWQIGAFFIARKYHKKERFDVMHHLTFGTHWMPSFLPLIPVPFIWGPIGGGESTPKPFFKTFSYRGRFYEYTRECVRWIGEHDPFVRLAARRSHIVLCKASETAQRIAHLGARSIKLFSESGIDREELITFKNISFRRDSKQIPFRLISIGRLLHLKGFHLGLMAFSQSQRMYQELEYWIIGDGPESARLKSLAKKLGISKRVVFWGQLSRMEVLKKLTQCDVLVHPSLHDSGGWVCIEAMAMGRPVICLDLGGPALQVTKETGFKIPANTPEQVVQDMANAILQLAKSPHLHCRMGHAAQQRVREAFLWDHKGTWIREVYKKIC